jgi:hypothetical protein
VDVILIQINPVKVLTPCLHKIHFNIILSHMLLSSKRCLHYRLLHHNFVCIFHLPMLSRRSALLTLRGFIILRASCEDYTLWVTGYVTLPCCFLQCGSKHTSQWLSHTPLFRGPPHWTWRKDLQGIQNRTPQATRNHWSFTRVRFQVLTAACMKFRFFWDVATCSYVELDRRFRGEYCLHHQDGDLSPRGF